MESQREWPGSLVENVLRELAGLVPVGTPIHFTLDGTWFPDVTATRLEFTCPQVWPGEVAPQPENESVTPKN